MLSTSKRILKVEMWWFEDQWVFIFFARGGNFYVGDPLIFDRVVTWFIFFSEDLHDLFYSFLFDPYFFPGPFLWIFQSTGMP